MFLIIIKLQKCVSLQVKSYLLRYVPDQYKTQQMCDEDIWENGGTFQSVPDCYKNQEINKAVNNYFHALEVVPECYNTQKTYDKAVDTQSSAIKFVTECRMTQKKWVIK